MRVLVLGYGSREHALAWKIAQSPRVAEVFVAPGNAGTAEIATNVPISDEATDELVAYALANQIDLTVVGTNDPLALGVVDAFQVAGLAIFGPNQAAAQLEASKAFAKRFMERHGIPTSDYATFEDHAEAVAHLDTLPEDSGMIVKVSGLGRLGMGVTVCDDRQEAEEALRLYMVDRILGEAADTVIIEERLHGPEVSVFAVSDGTVAYPLMPVRDHKRIYENDQGPNTGGIAAYGPPADTDEAFVDHVMETIIQPTITNMAAEGNPYVGVLFAGLMITDQGPQVLEFNCRFGNPEALVLMELMENDLVDLIEACITGNLSPGDIQFRDGAAAAVVMSSPTYPADGYPVGLPISGVNDASALTQVDVFHHGTAMEAGQLVTSGGRVLAVTGVGFDIPSALARVYCGIDCISFDGAQYRRDIGPRVDDDEPPNLQAWEAIAGGKASEVV